MRERLQIVLRLIATCGLMISLVQCDGLFGDEETAEAECTPGETQPCDCFIEGVVDTAIQTCGPNGEFGGCDCDHLSDSSNQTGDMGGGEERNPTEGGQEEEPDEGNESIAFLMNDVTIQQLGTQDATGFIAQLLGAQWSFDIDEQNLNILFLIKNYNEATGEAVVQMAFGKADTIDSLCIDPETLSDEYTVAAPDLVFFLNVDLVSIYSEDSEGVPFYCDSDPSIPNALPLRSIEGQMDVDADLQNVSGALNGCISEEEASTLCTCVGPCSGNAHPSCGGCPVGSAPLLERLGTISTTDDCTEKMGQPAFNLHLDLSGSRINPPALCD